MAGERGPLAVHCAWREWEDDEAILWVREVLGETESTRATQMPAGMVRGGGTCPLPRKLRLRLPGLVLNAAWRRSSV